MTERLDRFMARANTAYYATHDPFADFTTAPEISQVFGEILGLWAAVTWQSLGSPNPVMLVEAGPGRGTLMVDALRAIRRAAPEFATALSLHLLETSPRLRAMQAERLPEGQFHAELATLPDTPMLLLANEFLDALPIRQFVRRGQGWTERFVEDGAFLETPAVAPQHLALGPPSPAMWERETRGSAEGEGTVVEICEPALDFAASLGARFAQRPGAALILDYGPEHSAPGDSLQAIADGAPTDPLGAPGDADLTAHVDFAALAATARQAGAAAHGPIPQGIFLTQLGLFQRTDRLARGQSPSRAAALIAAASRLVEPNRMGRLFKALALCHPNCPTPPGFEA